MRSKVYKWSNNHVFIGVISPLLETLLLHICIFLFCVVTWAQLLAWITQQESEENIPDLFTGGSVAGDSELTAAFNASPAVPARSDLLGEELRSHFQVIISFHILQQLYPPFSFSFNYLDLVPFYCGRCVSLYMYMFMCLNTSKKKKKALMLNPGNRCHRG